MRRSTNLTATGFSNNMHFPLVDSAQEAIYLIPNNQFLDNTGINWNQKLIELTRDGLGGCTTTGDLCQNPSFGIAKAVSSRLRNSSCQARVLGSSQR